MRPVSPNFVDLGVSDHNELARAYQRVLGMKSAR